MFGPDSARPDTVLMASEFQVVSGGAQTKRGSLAISGEIEVNRPAYWWPGIIFMPASPSLEKSRPTYPLGEASPSGLGRRLSSDRENHRWAAEKNFRRRTRLAAI